MRLCLSGVVWLRPQGPRTLVVLMPLFCICHSTTRALVDRAVSSNSAALSRSVLGQAGRLRPGEDARHRWSARARHDALDVPRSRPALLVYMKHCSSRSKHDGERRCSIAVNALHLYPHGTTCKDPWFKSEHRLSDRCCARSLCVYDAFLSLCPQAAIMATRGTVNIRLYTLQLYIRVIYNWEILSNEGAREGCKRP